MEVYGLTGGIGSGKSTVASMLEEYGIPVVSADELSRMVVAPGSDGLKDVVEAFGAEVLDERGELDRKKMGRIVFATTERRRQLEAILHPRIRERYEQVLDALEKAGHNVMIYEVPLLFEKKLDEGDEMKAVVLVTATADTRIARVKARDSLTTEDVLARMQAQMPEPEKRQRADYIIHNDSHLDDLRREVEHLITRFLRLPPRATTTTPVAEVLPIPDPTPARPAATQPPPRPSKQTTPPVASTRTTPVASAEVEVAQLESGEVHHDDVILEPSDAVILEPSSELEIKVRSSGAPASPPSPGASNPRLEVELVANPDGKKARRSAPPRPRMPGTPIAPPEPPTPAASPIPRVAPPPPTIASPPAPAAPASPPPAVSPRMGTAPQLDVPTLDGDGEGES